MNKDDQKSTSKIRSKPPVKGKQQVNKIKAESEKAAAGEKAEISNSTSNAKDHNEPNPNSDQVKQPAQNSSPETEMEVHHHPQLEHKHKPFKEYLLEGFMIFIAVMMGFIAENIRENISDHEHVKQLTSQLVQELKVDTLKLNEISVAENKLVKNNDTLLNLLQQPLKKADAKRILKFIADSHSLWPFHSSAGAIGAIKSELHLKQLSDSKIISYIATYEGHIALLQTVQDITLQYQRSSLDPFLKLHFLPTKIDSAFDLKRPRISNVEMRNITQEDLTQLGADMVLIRINTNELVTDNAMLKNDVVNLLKYVNEQYQ